MFSCRQLDIKTVLKYKRYTIKFILLYEYITLFFLLNILKKAKGLNRNFSPFAMLLKPSLVIV